MPFSYSQLHSYRTCPRQYEYANVKKIPRSISAGESFGTSVHSALRKWGEREMGSRGNREMGLGSRGLGAQENQLKLFIENDNIPHSISLSLQSLLDIWHSSFIIEGYATRVEADHARKRGESIMRHFYDWWVQETRVVLAVEKGFSLPLQDFTLTGRFDRVEDIGGSLRIIDFKTSVPRSQEEVDHDLQLSFYALAAEKSFHKPCAELLFLFLSEDGALSVGTTRSEGQLRDAEKQIREVHARIAERDFHPTPSARVCRSCPYRGICDVAAA